MSYVEFKNVSKIYEVADNKIYANNNVNLNINKNEFCVIVGPSGAGKTTLLNLLGGMESPTSGSIIVDGEHIEEYNDKKLTLFRRYDVGFVFQLQP